MVAVKTEINLRTREFTITREFYWPRLLITLTVIAVAVLLLGGSLFVYLYQMQLEVENNYLSQEKSSLQARVEPVLEMEAKTRDLEEREKLAGALLKDIFPCSAHFRKINGIVQGYDLKATSLIASGKDRVRISGFSESMQQISLFMQALEEDEATGTAVYKYMTFAREHNIFRYEIELVLASGGEQ